jgi:hypothetical protein
LRLDELNFLVGFGLPLDLDFFLAFLLLAII